MRKIINVKGKKLDDGKGIDGTGRLRKKKVATLQNYFGFSIRQNPNNLERMRADVMAVLYQLMKISSIIFAPQFPGANIN